MSSPRVRAGTILRQTPPTRDGWGGEAPWRAASLPAAPLSLYPTVLSAMVRRGGLPLFLGIAVCGLIEAMPRPTPPGSNVGAALAMVSAIFGIIGAAAVLQFVMNVFFTPYDEEV